MKRLTDDVLRWYLYRYRRATGQPFPDDLDSRQQRIGDEVFARFFLGDAAVHLSDKDADADEAAWARGVHAMVEALPAYKQVAQSCRGNFDACVDATRAVLDSLPKEVTGGDSAPPSGTARDAADGLDGVQMANQPWTGKWQGDAEAEARARALADRLKDDDRLKRIALLAGKFKRVAVTREKVRVRRGADEISDVVQGDDLGRLLPTELARLVSRRARLAALRDLSERKCLQYEMTSAEELGRGPVVLCVDKSPSMEGDKDIWATAAALALCEAAHRQRRTFVLLCFNDQVFYRKVVKPGMPMPESALFVPTSGGTDVGRVLDLALGATESRTVMRRADVVVVTDGQSSTATAAQIRARAQRGKVRVYGLGIGVPTSALSPWCDEVHAFEDVSGIDDEAAGMLFGR